jgi:hypothetical protein
MKRKLLVLSLITWLAVGVGMTALWAQESVDTTPVAPAVSSFTVTRQDNYFVVNGKPLVLLWARGLADAQDIPAYRQTGLNALYVNAGNSDDTLAAAANLLAAGAENELPTLVGLDTSVAANNVTVNPHYGPYQQAVRAYVQAVVPQLAQQPGVIGWIVEAIPYDQISPSDADFRAWLQTQYNGIAALNDAWRSKYNDFVDINRDQCTQWDADQPGRVGRATIDRGLYYYWLNRDMMALWSNEIRRADSSRPVIIVPQNDYRALVTVPPSYAGVITTMYQPTPAAQGGFSGIEAIDMARRANYFVPMAYANLSQGVAPATLYDWASQALIHGASGFGFSSWETIKNSTDLQRTLKQLNTLAVRSRAFPRTPQAMTAFLYEPFAGGTAYGYLPQGASNEPGLLFRTFGRGTRFGPVDYLTEDMLSAVPLGNYGTIFMPIAYTVSNQSQQALAAYVNNGGAIVADWGLGAYETGTLNMVPDPLAKLFGIGFIYAVARTPMDIAVFSPDPLFPSLELQDLTSGRNGGAFNGLLGDVKILDTNAKRLMTTMSYSTYVPSIVLNHVGSGAAIFASAPLWENWQHGDSLFDAFHGDLLNRKRNILIQGTDSLFVNADVARYTDGSIALFRTAGTPTRVQFTGTTRNLYLMRGGYQQLGVANPLLVMGAPGINVLYPIPLTLQDMNDEVFVSVKNYSAQGITLEVRGAGVTFAAGASGVQAQGGKPFLATLVVPDDVYPVAPNSKHTVKIRSLASNKPATTQTVTAAGDILNVKLTGTAIEVTIAPVQTEE